MGLYLWGPAACSRRCRPFFVRPGNVPGPGVLSGAEPETALALRTHVRGVVPGNLVVGVRHAATHRDRVVLTGQFERSAIAVQSGSGAGKKDGKRRLRKFIGRLLRLWGRAPEGAGGPGLGQSRLQMSHSSSRFRWAVTMSIAA